MTIGSIFLILFIVGWCALVLIIVRKQLKLNNIFTKNPWANRGDGPPLKKDKPTMKFIYLFALAAFFDALGIIFSNSKSSNYDAYFFYNRSWFFTVAGVINAVINRQDDSFNVRPYLRYAMKLWFSFVFLPPVLLMLNYAINNHFSEDTFYKYGTFVIYTHGLVMPPLIVLILAIRYISKTTWGLPKKRFRTFIAAEIIVIIALATVQNFSPVKLNWTLTWVTYLLITAISVFYYHFEELVFFDN